jgi:hypothetical protein
VAIFPEGTTTDGSQLLHFHAALLQPAIACGHPVQPLALQYRTPDDRFSRAPAYDGDLSLGECIANIIARRARSRASPWPRRSPPRTGSTAARWLRGRTRRSPARSGSGCRAARTEAGGCEPITARA